MKTSRAHPKICFLSTNDAKITNAYPYKNYSEKQKPQTLTLSLIKTVFYNTTDIGHMESTCNREAKELVKAVRSAGKPWVSSGKSGQGFTVASSSHSWYKGSH